MTEPKPRVPVDFNSWPDEKLKILKDLWYRRERSEDIGAVLDKTARAVRHKAERMGYERGPVIIATPSPIRDVAHHSKEPIPRVLDDGSAICMANVTRKDCQWIPGEPGSHAQMCGHRTHKHSPWCEDHYKRVYPRSEDVHA